jgi:hypothetical protein
MLRRTSSALLERFLVFLHVLEADKLMQSPGERSANIIQWLRLPDDWNLLYVLFS